MKKEERVKILGVPIDRVDFSQTIGRVAEMVEGKGSSQIITVNPEIILHSQKNNGYRQILLNSVLNTADGIGIIWAAKYLQIRKNINFRFFISDFCLLLASLVAILLNRKWLYSEIPERVTGADLMKEILEQATKEGWRIFLLGAEPGVAKDLKEILEKKYSKIKIVGTYEGSPEDRKGAKKVGEIAPDILFVAYSSPGQQIFINENLEIMKAKVAIGVGGSFNFLTGRIKRAPKIMQSLGLEWMWRLFLQPGRIVRIFNATAKFVWSVFRSKS